MDESEEDEGRFIVKPTLRPRPPIRNPPQPYQLRAQYPNYREFEQEDIEFDDDEETPKFNNNTPTKEYHYNSYYENESNNSKKKRKTESLVSNYEFDPRTSLSSPKTRNIGESSKDNWNEEGSFVLLEVWGERYLELGRRSLRHEDWADVAEKVSEMTGVVKSEMECRVQLDVLKMKFKKERAKMDKVGGGFASKWVFFKKMDVLLNLRMRGHCGLGCGVDSGEYVFMNPRMYLDKSNVLDEMRDSPGQSDEEDDEEDDGLGEEEEDNGESTRMLAEAIQRFGEIYENIESSKRKQMAEMEKMRRDFQRDLELHKKQIADMAQTEINKIREMDNDDDDHDHDHDHNDNDGDNDVEEEQQEQEQEQENGHEEEEGDNDDENDVPSEDLQT